MARIAFARYSELVRYDSANGIVLVFDQRAAAPLHITHADEHAEPLRALAAVEPLAHAFALGYTLALAAREWRDRPTDARRGALIQMTERLNATSVLPAGMHLLNEALQEADIALVRGDDAERAITRFVAERVRLADRAADRCGRHAINLIDNGDCVLTYGFGGPPLFALLGALPTLEPPATLLAAGQNEPALLQSLMADMAVQAAHATQPPTLCIVAAWALARDGSAVCASGCGALIEQARQAGIPCYLLAPFGPDANVETATQLALPNQPVDIVLPGLISAIVTDRGMYRPAMIDRYLGENDAPPDVIPLM